GGRPCGGGGGHRRVRRGGVHRAGVPGRGRRPARALTPPLAAPTHHPPAPHPPVNRFRRYLTREVVLCGIAPTAHLPNGWPAQGPLRDRLRVRTRGSPDVAAAEPALRCWSCPPQAWPPGTSAATCARTPAPTSH